ncbi:MAG: cardiolipin synthase [Acholeplasmataceae bacterium]|jgi:cardiolipin synthase
MKKLYRFLTNKNTIITFTIFIQIMMFFAIILVSIFYKLKIGLIISLSLLVLSYLISIYILSRSTMHQAYKFTWVSSILLFPIFGGAFYLYYNTRNYSKKQRAFYDETSIRMKQILKEKNIGSNNQIINYLTGSGWANYKNTKVDFYHTGEEIFAQIIEDLKKAEKFILIQFFIIKQGKIWDTILEILKDKVANGVEVKIIYDDWGSYTLPFKYYKKIFKNYGIEMIAFNPMLPKVNFQMNFRNHRKIIVIDGKIGYTGGFNIADEYANLVERFGYWLDNGIKLTGEAVYTLTLTFLSDWEFATKNKIDYRKYDVKHNITCEYEVTPYADSPLIDETHTLDALLRMIGQAKEVIYLSSPYLIIDSELSNALSLLARSGVEVNIVIPAIPDKKFVYIVSESNIPELVKNGVNIYKYNPGFIHSKIFMVDNVIASVGTSNLDYRSLFLHFENNVIFNNKETILEIEKFFKNTIADSTLVELDKIKKRNIFYRALQNILRSFSPLL